MPEEFEYYASHYELSLEYRDAYIETKNIFEEGEFKDLCKEEIIESLNRHIYDWEDIADTWLRMARRVGCYLV